jgi:MoaA/NifB/PqqE/SkfB family radical SAM enzyme
MSTENQLESILAGENKYLNVTWQVNNQCNYRCSYCNPGNWQGDHKNKDTDKYILYLFRIIDHFKKRGYTAFKFFFSGGEPCNWKPLIDICKFLHEEVDSPLLAINTNLSKPLKWWEENHHYFQDVVASYHPEFAEYDKFLTNAQFLQDKVNYLAIRMMMHDEMFKEQIETGEKLYEEMDNCAFEWVPLLDDLQGDAKPWEYSEQWKKDFFKETEGYKRKFGSVEVPFKSKPMYSVEKWGNDSYRVTNSNRLSAQRLNFFKGWKCFLNDAIFIAPNGDVTGGSCGVSGKIGNMNEGWLNLDNTSVICPREYCPCGTDMIIPKIKPGTPEFDREDYDIVKKELINL